MTNEINSFRVGSYTLDADRFYSRESHMWVAATARPPELATRARVGFDPLGSETSGDIVAVSFEPVGTKLKGGEPFGQLEAAKFVGPLIAPLSGTIAAHNGDVLANPLLINSHPLDSWLIELDSMVLGSALAGLLHGREAVGEWFRRDLERFLAKGMVAE